VEVLIEKVLIECNKNPNKTAFQPFLEKKVDQKIL